MKQHLILPSLLTLIVLTLFGSVAESSNRCFASENTDYIRSRSTSPNGKLLAYALISDTTSSLCVTDTSGQSDPIVVETLDLPAFVSDTDWSPDGRFLAFEVDSGEDIAVVYQADIYVETVGSWGLFQDVSRGTGVSTQATWSPDSRYIAYEAPIMGADRDINIWSIKDRRNMISYGHIGTDIIVGWDGSTLISQNLEDGLTTTFSVK